MDKEGLLSSMVPCPLPVVCYHGCMFSNPRAILDVFCINVGMTVADFGAGDGAYAKELVKRVGSDGVVYAFDVQKAYIERLAAYVRDAKAHMLKPQWVDLELAGGTQLAPASLDAALVANILFQIENKEIFMAEVARVLRPNGRVLIVDWSESFNNLVHTPIRWLLLMM